MTSTRSTLRRRVSAVGGAAFALVIGVTLVGCVTDPEPSQPDAVSLDPSIQLPPQNQDLWVLPIDLYVPSLAQSRKETYATVLLVQDCLAETGMNVPIPRPNLEDGGDRGVRELLTPEVAAEYGYRSPSWMASMDTSDAWVAFLRRPVSDGYRAAEQRCYDSIEAPSFSGDMLNYALSFSNAAFMGAMRDEEVLKAGAGWNQCMSGSGIEDLPDTPDGMPTTSIFTRFGLGQSPDAGQEIAISAEERTTAVADATCRQTTGYAAMLYQANWDRQVRLLAENSTALQDMGAKIAEIDAALNKVVAEHAQQNG